MNPLKMRRMRLRKQETSALLPISMRYARKPHAAEIEPLMFEREKLLRLNVCSIIVATLNV